MMSATPLPLSLSSSSQPLSLQAGVDPQRPLASTRLLAVDDDVILDEAITSLPQLLQPGDLLVLNDSATLPASLHGVVDDAGAPVEVRLASRALSSAPPVDLSDAFPHRWLAVVFGAGDWRDDTDVRPAPPPMPTGSTLRFGDDANALKATVKEVSSTSSRLVELLFDRRGAALAQALYDIGHPVQYRHLPRALQLHHVQTPFAWRPWSMEMPSTGRPLSWALLDALQNTGVDHVFLTHAAGLSATGDADLDATLPFAEPYDVPDATFARVLQTRQQGGRVVAVGTTVVRALESAAQQNRLQGVATLRLDEHHELAVVDDILTGVHSPGESHFELLKAFASTSTLLAAHHDAAARGYLAHELGDLMLVRGRRL